MDWNNNGKDGDWFDSYIDFNLSGAGDNKGSGGGGGNDGCAGCLIWVAVIVALAIVL